MSPSFQYQHKNAASPPQFGAENAPQWMKIPTFASSNQLGRGLESSDAQFGW